AASAIEKILAAYPPDKVARNTCLAAVTLRQGPLFVFDATLEDDFVCLSFEGLKRVEGPSQLGDFHYLPMLFYPGERIPHEQRLLLGVLWGRPRRIAGQTARQRADHSRQRLIDVNHASREDPIPDLPPSGHVPLRHQRLDVIVALLPCSLAWA